MRSVDAALEVQSPEPVEGEPRVPSSVPLVWLYLACVGSWGLCIPVWAYRTARAFDPAPELRRKHLAWAAGCLMPWVACLVAYELTRQAQVATPEPRGRRPRLPLLVFAVAAVLVCVLFGTPLAELHTLKLLLLPLPVILCQAAVNRSAAAGTPSRPAELGGRTKLALRALAVLGLPAALLIIVLDADTWERFRAPSYAQGARITGTSGRYELTLSTGEWRRVPSGTWGDADTELELERTDRAGENWLVAYVEPEGTLDLDARVEARKAVIEQAATRLKAVQEERYFADQESFAVASLARYEAVIAGAQTRFWVFTAIAHGSAIELVAHSDAPVPDDAAMQQMLQAVALVDRKEAPPR